MPTTVARKLEKFLNLPPGNGETALSYATRLATAANKLSDEDWTALGAGPKDGTGSRAQRWVNKFLMAQESGEELPPLHGNPQGDYVKPEPGEEPEPKAKSKKADKTKRGRRGAYPMESTITILAESNPKRPGSKAAQDFDRYKTGMTIEEALKAGIGWNDIKWNVDKKFIKVE
jgi:hypothetical protein